MLGAVVWSSCRVWSCPPGLSLFSEKGLTTQGPICKKGTHRIASFRYPRDRDTCRSSGLCWSLLLLWATCCVRGTRWSYDCLKGTGTIEEHGVSTAADICKPFRSVLLQVDEVFTTVSYLYIQIRITRCTNMWEGIIRNQLFTHVFLVTRRMLSTRFGESSLYRPGRPC